MSRPGAARRKPADSWIAVALRLFVVAAAGLAAAWDAATGPGLYAAAGGAMAGVVAAELISRSRARLPFAFLLALALTLLAFGGWSLLTRWAVVSNTLGTGNTIATGDALLLGGLAAALCLVLRVTGARYRIVAGLELAVLAAALAAPLAAHRGGAINRPLGIGDYAWSQGQDPVIYLQLAGGVAAVGLALFLIMERRWLRAIATAVLVLVAAVGMGYLASMVLPPTAPGDLGLGLTGRGAEEGGGGGKQGPRSLDQLDFRDNYSSKQRSAPVAVVLLHDDYRPPDKAFYFRQKAFSRYNGRRLVPALETSVDQDVFPFFPSTKREADWVPPSAYRIPVTTSIALLQDHVNPVVLEAAQTVAPAKNPSPRRFRRAYIATSLSLDVGIFELLRRDTGFTCDEDIDRDGVASVDDNCALHPNPGQEDEDEDGRGDICEGDGAELLDSCSDDIDGDGVANDADNCPLVPNEAQVDGNGNGFGDACEGDLDGDGLPDAEDNCPEARNPRQYDLDMDGIGDHCDDDWDGDDIGNARDRCPMTPSEPGAGEDDGFGDAEWSPEILALYLEGPEDPRYAKLANKIVDTLRDEYRDDPVARAKVIADDLGRRGTYSLRSRHAGAADPTASFLFGDMTGYCVHFAHAAVYLYRAAGVPSRLSTGYQYPSKLRGRGSSILLRGGDAHAWPEIYVRGVGWVVVDVAPAKNLEPPGNPLDPDLQRMLGEMLRGQLEEQRRASLAIGDAPLGVGDLLAGLQAAARILLAVLAALMLLLYAGKIYRRVVPRVAASSQRTRLCYRLALDRLSDVGVRRSYGEPPEQFAERIASLAPSLAALAQAAAARKLGSARLDDPEGAQELSRKVAAEVARAVPWWRRVVGAFDPLAWLRVR